MNLVTKITIWLRELGRKLVHNGKMLIYKGIFLVRYPGVEIVSQGKRTFYSQAGQDAYVAILLFRCLHFSANNKVVVEVGCNHPTLFSNSYFFEKYFQCRTIAIDPLKKLEDVWKVSRPDAAFVACAVGEGEGTADFYVPRNPEMFGVSYHSDMLSSLNGYGKRLEHGHEFERYKVPIKTLSNILDEFSINDIIYCSIDTEGNELEVLRGIDFERHHILCFSIENNDQSTFGDDQVRIFMAEKGYRFVARIWKLDDIFIREDLITPSSSPGPYQRQIR